MSQANWSLDPAHTLLEFAVKHMMIATVKGRFGTVEGSVIADPTDLTTAQVNISTDVSSIDTRDEQRDGHLRSADFFDMENHPKVTFRSTQIERKDGDEYAITGDLTIRGVTRQVVFNAVMEGQGKDPWGNERFGLSAQTKVNRKEFGLLWNVALEAGGILVSEDVRISVELQAIKQAA
jgi:polyisoprenoid-binding protein YceI